jgi:endogenous inhibitor of DNA gyrase (YacG/DUF329 family)
MSEKTKSCPICGKPTDPQYRPHCSKQCSYVDLGRWLGDGYVIKGEETVPLAGSGQDEDDY